MLTNLFSIFDTSLTALNPFIFMVMVVAFVMGFNFSSILEDSNNLKVSKKVMMLQLENQFSASLAQMKSWKKNMKTLTLKKVIILLFCLVFLLNFFSLFPFILSTTSHMSLNLNLSILMWSLSVVLALSNNPSSFFAHLTPSGTPLALMSFMVIIETISNIIRPLTLAVRLMANMVAGHLLLSLLSKFSLLAISFMTYSAIPLFVLGVLEMGVSIIQAYVITLLCTLYIKDAYN